MYKDPEERRAYNRRWYQRHRDEQLEIKKDSYTRNKAAVREYGERYREVNSEIIKARKHRYSMENREKLGLVARKNALKRLYGLTLEGFDKMLEAQGDLCLICSKKRRLVVDHDHVTGKVRGLVCRTCNLHLGWYERYKDKAEEYLLP